MLMETMRLIARRTLAAFGALHPEARASLAHWMSVTKAASWTNVAEVQASFSKAKALNGERVRFEVAGGDYRMIVAFDFRRSIAFVKFVDTHAEHDRIDARGLANFRSASHGHSPDPYRRGASHGAGGDRGAVGRGGRHAPGRPAGRARHFGGGL